MRYLVVFTGGGTGGHVFPGFAVAEELGTRYGVEIVWIGSRRGIERRLVEERGLRYSWVFVGKLRRYFSLQNLVDAARLPAGVLMAIFRLWRMKPAVVFSKGGFVAVPVVIAAAVLRIPVVAHESDYDPGLATRISARFAVKVLVPYQESVEFFDGAIRDRVVVTGNPVRAAVAAGDAQRGRRLLGMSGARPIVLFLGGSLGSAQINELLECVLDRLLESCDVVHQTGAHQTGAHQTGAHQTGAHQAHALHDGRSVAAGRKGAYYHTPFFAEEFPDVLAAADLVVSRAGAGTVWENFTAGKAAVLVPLGAAGSRGDQLRNAELCRARGAAKVLEPNEATPERLLSTLLALIHNHTEREQLARRARAMAVPEAAARIAEIVDRQVGES